MTIRVTMFHTVSLFAFDDLIVTIDVRSAVPVFTSTVGLGDGPPQLSGRLPWGIDRFLPMHPRGSKSSGIKLEGCGLQELGVGVAQVPIATRVFGSLGIVECDVQFECCGRWKVSQVREEGERLFTFELSLHVMLGTDWATFNRLAIGDDGNAGVSLSTKTVQLGWNGLRCR